MKKANWYDIIVVGAGPAGCTVAKILSQNGYDVLLIEKFKLPRYKSCSGQLIRRSVELVEKYFGENIPNSVLCTPIENKGMIFTNDKGKSYCFEQSGLNIWRSSFDYWLTVKAAQSGSEIRDCTSVVACKKENGLVAVTLKGEKIYTEYAKYVVDCEGVSGGLKRKLIGGPSPHITTYQTFNQGYIDLDYHYFYAYLQPELSEYDAWFNVKDGQLVLGVAVKDNRKIGYYYNRFLSYMQNNHQLRIDKQLKIDKWLMPHIQPHCKIDYGVGSIFFAGEIAGFLNPMGEGISAGLESGFCIAQSIISYFGQLDRIYTNYKESTKDLHSYMKRQWGFVADMVDSFREFKM